MTTILPKSRQNDLVVQQSKAEILIYDLNNNKAFCLNEVAAMIWLECDGNKDVTQISLAVSKKTKHNASSGFVRLALGQLANENLLSDNEFWREETAEYSRRNAIKKIGLGTLLALPLITTIVAPKAIQAASTGTCLPPNNTGSPGGTVVGNCPFPTIQECEPFCFTLDSLCQNCLVAPSSASFWCPTCPPEVVWVCVCT